jgi:hypothetical protein
MAPPDATNKKAANATATVDLWIVDIVPHLFAIHPLVQHPGNLTDRQVLSLISARTKAALAQSKKRLGGYGRQARNTELEQKACEIRLRAERRCGQLLKVLEMAKGTRGQRAGGSTVRPPETAQPLAELGISKTQSSRWQKLADVPEEDFEATSRELTTAYTNYKRHHPIRKA